ncbi:MAG: glycosyltransferase [Clostridia bacterium]|nr:glycosyltransferase [Clostridia bacterium]
MNPIISIIVPFYNGEKYLKECIESFINQTFTDFEVILVDDGSVDGSVAVAKELMAKDGRIKLISQQNKGVSTARNVAMKEASGEYFMFVDADDRLRSDALFVLYESLKKSGCDVVTGEYVSFKGKELPSCTKGDKPARIYGSDDIKKLASSMGKNQFFQYVWRRLFSAKLIRDNGIEFDPDIAIGEDTLFCLECFLNAKSVLNIPDVVYEYRYNPQGAMRSKKYNAKLTKSVLLQYVKKKELCQKYFPQYMKEFLSDSAVFSYRKGCRLMFDNMFFKGNGGYKEFLTIVRSDMLRDMFRHLNINGFRSKSLDWIALKLVSLRLYFVAYFVEKIMYKVK